MARPRSEDKQAALLSAATEIVAAQGLGAPTSAIAKLAGVAEGTLFRYFPTKDGLLSSLFAHLASSVGAALRESHDETAPLKARVRLLWNSYIDWGIANPSAFSALNQLAVSEKLKQEVLEATADMCRDMQGLSSICRFPGLVEDQSGEFSDAMFTALAQVAINFSSIHPERTDAYKAAGFDVVWRGLVGD